MNGVDRQTLQASFASQDAAESAIRKLSALRGDNFRLEKKGSVDPGRTPQAALTSGRANVPGDYTDTDEIYTGGMGLYEAEASSNLGEFASPEALYSLSVQVPGLAAEQARTVLLQAGGTVE